MLHKLGGHHRRASFTRRGIQEHIELNLDRKIRFSETEKPRRMLQAEGFARVKEQKPESSQVVSAERGLGVGLRWEVSCGHCTK